MNVKNNHIIDNISFKEFKNTQKIYEMETICQICNNTNKSETFENKFFRCLSCKLDICPLCISNNHDRNHAIINYDNKHFICDLHNESYNSYCKNFKKDICLLCENLHINHETISYGLILPIIIQLFKELDNLKIKIYKLKEHNSLLFTNLQNCFEIYQNIIINFDNKKRNFVIMQNIIDMNYDINILNKLVNSEILENHPLLRIAKIFMNGYIFYGKDVPYGYIDSYSGRVKDINFNNKLILYNGQRVNLSTFKKSMISKIDRNEGIASILIYDLNELMN